MRLTPARALLKTLLVLFCSIIAVGFGPTLRGVVIVPNGDASVEGNSNAGLPFNIQAFALTSDRLQQVFNASDFSSLSGPVLITQIIFRPDASQGSSFSSTLPNIRIDLSTTSAAADALSTTFANNVGADDTIVFSGSLSLSSAFTGPAGGPKDFDIVINLTTPFVYDPSSGNLLMDVRNFGGGSTTFFDAEFTSGDAISRVYTFSSGDVNSATASDSDTSGLVTSFTTTPVPEPSPSWFMAVGAVGLLLIARRRQEQRTNP